MKNFIFSLRNREYQAPDLYKRMNTCIAAALKTGARHLDWMDYSALEFKSVLDIKSTEDVLQLSHGYTSPDGSPELGDLIKELELQRLVHNAGKARAEAEKTIRPLAVGVGLGTTGVIRGLIASIINLNPKGVKARNAEVILPLPTYSIDGVIKTAGLKSAKILTKRENNFLPLAEEIETHINRNTIALILTWPNNPSFTTYDEPTELRKIVELCQKNKIFLLADNIYQDMHFDGKKHIEVFSLTASADFIIKVFGLSKDRPFFTGHRIGYFIGDPVLKEHFFDYCDSNYFCITSLAKGLLALDLLFRIAMGKNAAHISLEDAELIRPISHKLHEVKKINHHALFQKINKTHVFETYLKNLKFNQKKMREALFTLIDYVKHSDVFSDISNNQIGNAIFVKVNPEYYSGSDQELFEELLYKKKIAIMPGNVFGMEIKPGETWFRFTLIHKSRQEILQTLQEVENFLQSKV